MERGPSCGAVFLTSWGWAAAVASSVGLCRLHWPLPSEEGAWDILRRQSEPILPLPLPLVPLRSLLEAYLSGEAVTWSFSLDLRPGTPFQQAVWRWVGAIPYGQTRTYRQVAEAVGRPEAQRAVGQALRGNPLPLIIPCHRVVGSRGEMRGYTGPAGSPLAGIPLKERLLALEGADSLPRPGA